MSDDEAAETHANGPVEVADHLYQRAAQDPYQIATADIRHILEDPAVPSRAHEHTIRALSEVVASGRISGSEFVEHLEPILHRPSGDSAVVLECLYEIAQTDPDAVARVYDSIIEVTSLEGNVSTRHATNCCVELVDDHPEVVMESVPLFGALLDADDHRTRHNVLFVLCRLADEYPEEVLPAVQNVIEILGTEELTVTKTSFIGRVSRHHPEATREAIPTLDEMLTSTNEPKIIANIIGIYGDIATAYPEDVVDQLGAAHVCMGHTDETVRYNACAFFEDIAKHDPEAVEFAVDHLVDRLTDEDEGTRLKAISTLGEIKAETALDQILDLAQNDSSREVRSLARKAAHRIQESESGY